MKLQKLPAVLACFLLFLLTISPEFSEAGIPSIGEDLWSRIGTKIPGGSATPEEYIEKVESAEKLEKFQDMMDLYNEYYPGNLSPTCQHVTNIGPSESVTLCSLSKCTQSCNVYNSYNCGVCYTTSMCVCYN